MATAPARRRSLQRIMPPMSHPRLSCCACGSELPEQQECTTNTTQQTKRCGVRSKQC